VSAGEEAFRAGTASVDISPQRFPVTVSGGFLPRYANRVLDPLHARALVLDDGRVKLAIVVVDTLLMSRELIDSAKQRAAKSTGIPADRMLVCATHTHSAPSVVGALGTGVDPPYTKLLAGRIVEAIERAAKNLAPAKIGWAVADAPDETNCRRWIKRPDRIGEDPFGQRTVRAMMHPGYQNPDYIGPAGPKDPALTVLAVQSPDGQPVALLANYSMHYFGAEPVSADYFGRFCVQIARLIGADRSSPQFVAMMSQGTAGDLHWMDYSRPQKKIDLDGYTAQVARIAYQAYQKIRYHDRAPLAMAERKLTLARRTPDEKRLAWARQVIAKMKDRSRPTNIPEVYAWEQLALRDEPRREMILQAVRIGELGIAAMPTEVFGITGLKIKAQSPLEPTFNLELANGAEGYIPPPEQHKLGGYTTWPARSAGLEVQAEPKILETVLQLLEQVSGKPRCEVFSFGGAYQIAVRKSRPVAEWAFEEFAGPRAIDASGHNHHGVYEDGVVFYLDGVDRKGLSAAGYTNRAAHFAGGRMKARVPGLGPAYSVELWFWNGMPSTARPVTGYFFSRGQDGAAGAPGDHLGIGGTNTAAGKLIFFGGDACNKLLAGKTEIPLRTWNHVLLVRDGSRASVYLNFNKEPEIAGEITPGCRPDEAQIFLGGRNDNIANFEGKLDEVAVYDRAISFDELAQHAASAGAEAPAASQPRARAKPGDVRQLFTVFAKAPTRDNYLRVYEAMKASPDYDPYSRDLDEIEEVFDKSRFEEADARLKKAMPGHILSPKAHFLAGRIALRLDDKNRAHAEMELWEKCLDGLASTGNGSPESPYLVTRISDEYDLLRRLRKVRRRQGLLGKDNRRFDVLQCTDGSEVWFDVTEMFESLKRKMQKAAGEH
jgi:hypothetical protein